MTFSYRHRKLIVLLLLFLLSVTASFFIFRSHFTPKKKTSTKKIVLTPKKEETTTDNDTYYLVDIKGAINNPGTYSMKKGSRVIDVIHLAGELKSDADTSVLNLSKKVTDEMVIIVYSYDEVKNLMFDLYKNELEDGITKREAEDKLREVSLKIFGLTKDSSRRERERAYRDYGRQFFDVIEEVTDWTVTTGLKENEWFNALVNYANLKEGDKNLFVNEHEEVILSVARMGKRHHDTMLQRLPENTTYSVETDLYGAAVGADIDRYLIGQEDWTKLVDAITKAFTVMIQELIFAEILEAPKKLPVQSGFVETGALSTATRKKFNKVLQNVSVANDNADVVIMGTMVALQELEGLIDINWLADSQKEDKAKMGRLGNYGRYTLVEIPQRFARNDVTKDMYKDDVLWVFASGDNKMVDMVDVGETLIEEITDRGTANSNIADLMKYEVQREFGVATRLGRYFGQWTITE